MRVALRLPVIALVIAYTAVPFDLRPPTRDVLATVVRPPVTVPDLIANVVGYVPVGIVLAGLGPRAAVAGAAALSVFAETGQLFAEDRSPSLIDVAANVIGAIGGLLITARWRRAWRSEPPAIAIDRRHAVVAAMLSLAYAGFGGQLTSIGVEDTVTRAVDRWRLARLEVNARGASAPGRLEAHWTFDTVANGLVPDESGNGLTGRLVNAPGLPDGVAGGSLRLNGVDQYVDLGRPAALRLTGSQTVSAWINASAFPRDDAAIVSSHTGLGYQLDTTVDQGERTIAFKLTDAGGEFMARYGRTRLDVNTWYHVAGVYDAPARSLHVYLNGQPDDGCLAGRVTERQHASVADVYIGRRARFTGFEFAGAIDDVRIFSTARTAAEIAAEVRDTQAGRVTSDGLSGVRGTVSPCAPRDVSSRNAGLIVLFGIAIGLTCVGGRAGPFWPPLCLLMSFAAGFLLFPSVAPTIPAGVHWAIPFLTLAGGATITASARPRDI